METTRFLFPEETAGNEQQRTVFEPNAEGMPVVAAERQRQSSVPPMSGGLPSDGSLGQRLSIPTSGDGKLARYKHYDVQLDWSEVP